MIDAYCSKTVQWYDSRVLGFKTTGEGEMVKVHFMGWNSKFDEWIPKYGPNLAPLGTSSSSLSLSNGLLKYDFNCSPSRRV